MLAVVLVSQAACVADQSDCRRGVLLVKLEIEVGVALEIRWLQNHGKDAAFERVGREGWVEGTKRKPLDERRATGRVLAGGFAAGV